MVRDSDGRAPGRHFRRAATYTLDSADQGKKVKVRVGFTDRDGWPESLTSAAFPASDTVAAMSAANVAPTVMNQIPNQTAMEGVTLNYAFPTNTFNDTDTGDTLTYTAALSDDSVLPDWLTFTPGTRTFSGTPVDGDVGTHMVKVTASDGTATVSDTFNIVVGANCVAPTFGTGVRHFWTGEVTVGKSAPSVLDSGVFSYGFSTFIGSFGALNPNTHYRFKETILCMFRSFRDGILLP